MLACDALCLSHLCRFILFIILCFILVCKHVFIACRVCCKCTEISFFFFLVVFDTNFLFVSVGHCELRLFSPSRQIIRIGNDVCVCARIHPPVVRVWVGEDPPHSGPGQADIPHVHSEALGELALHNQSKCEQCVYCALFFYCSTSSRCVCNLFT